MSDTSYSRAQIAIANLKSAIRDVLSDAGAEGMTNAQIGRTLGIYTGHEGHEGHIPRTMLAIMENEGVVAQDDETNRWSLRHHGP